MKNCSNCNFLLQTLQEATKLALKIPELEYELSRWKNAVTPGMQPEDLGSSFYKLGYEKRILLEGIQELTTAVSNYIANDPLAHGEVVEAFARLNVKLELIKDK